MRIKMNNQPKQPPDNLSDSDTNQINCPLMTAEDIVAAYKLFFRRMPENQEVINNRIGLSANQILSSFLMSDEFTSIPDSSQLLHECIKSIEHKQSSKSKDPDALEVLSN